MESFIQSGNTDFFIDSYLDGTNGENIVEKLEGLKNFLGKCISSVNGRITKASVTQMKINTADDKLIQKFSDSSFLEPRGRFEVSVYSQGLSLEGKTASAFVKWDNVLHIFHIPSNMSTKKEGEDILVLLFKSAVKFNAKDTKQFLWNLSNTQSKLDLTIESEKVIETVSKLYNMPIIHTDKLIYQSVLNQKCYVRCHKGVQEGALYPMKTGLIFIKPMIYIPIESIHGINGGRGGSGSTKYVDFIIQTKTGESHEFSNIEREELLNLQAYIQQAMKTYMRQQQQLQQQQLQPSANTCTTGSNTLITAITSTSTSTTMMIENVEDDSDDEDDDDYDPNERDSDDDDDDDDNSDNSSTNSDQCQHKHDTEKNNGDDNGDNNSDSDSGSDSDIDDDDDSDNDSYASDDFLEECKSKKPAIDSTTTTKKMPRNISKTDTNSSRKNTVKSSVSDTTTLNRNTTELNENENPNKRMKLEEKALNSSPDDMIILD